MRGFCAGFFGCDRVAAPQKRRINNRPSRTATMRPGGAGPHLSPPWSFQMTKRISDSRMERTPQVAAVMLAAALAALAALAPCARAATFGTVVAVGGHAADLTLDEPRGVLYVANFGAGRIDVISV